MTGHPSRAKEEAIAEEPVRPAERICIALIFVGTLSLRLHYLFRYTFDPDEAQHLHVAWAWTQGLLQYRDVFDNHAPLFHMLSAPLVALIGETPNILFDMRLAVMPLYVATLWGTYELGRMIFGRRIGLWAAALLGPIPSFFFKSLEYRADDLWMCLWIWTIVVLLRGEFRWRRGRASGLLLGATLSTSLKTILLMAMLGLSALLVWRPGCRVAAGRRRAVLSLVAGSIALPLAITLYFAMKGAFRPFLYGTVMHNCVGGLGHWHQPWKVSLFVPAASVVVAGGWLLRRVPLPDEKRTRLRLVWLTAGLYMAALKTLWPIFPEHDLLTFYPLVMVVVVGLVALGWQRFTAWPRLASTGWVFLALISLLELGLILTQQPPSKNGANREVRLLTEVLKLTEPGDFVLDQKGQAIFRRRPTYYVMETIMRARLGRGDFPENIQEEVIARRTCVVAGEIDRFPERTQRFLEENFLPVGEVRVAGRFLPADMPVSEGPVGFEVVIPARYAIVAEEGQLSGFLDGEPYTGATLLEAGRHTFVGHSDGGRLALVWARAIERGFAPFSVPASSS